MLSIFCGNFHWCPRKEINAIHEGHEILTRNSRKNPEEKQNVPLDCVHIQSDFCFFPQLKQALVYSVEDTPLMFIHNKNVYS